MITSALKPVSVIIRLLSEGFLTWVIPESIIKQYMGVDDLSDDEQDIDDDIADKWLGGDSDDDEQDENDKDESANKSKENDEEESEIQQALEDLISADDDDELLVPGEVIGVKESVEIRVTSDSAAQSVELTSTQNESQSAVLDENEPQSLSPSM